MEIAYTLGQAMLSRTNFLSDLDAVETESFEIIDVLDRMGDFWKESRLPSHKHNDKETVETAWEKHKENNPDMEKYEGAMTEDGLDEERIEENSSKSAEPISPSPFASILNP